MNLQPERQLTDRQEAPESVEDEYPKFTAVYEHYATPLFAYFYRHVRQRQDAEDLTATTFSKALTSIEHYSEQGSFEAWLWSIARHTLRDAQRRQREAIDIEHVAFQLIDPAPPAETQVLQAEQLEMMHQLLHGLPADQRQAVILRFMREWSFNDIARSLGRSIGAVKMLVQRALATLRMHYPQFEQFEGVGDAGRSGIERQTTGATFRLQRVIGIWMSVIIQCWHALEPQPVLILQPVPIPVYNSAIYAARRRR
jgi:RNA polymerase sigma factor (sigma-70 family)